MKPLDPDEINAVAATLKVAAEWFEQCDETDFALEASKVNKALAVAASEHQASLGWEADDSPHAYIEELMASTDDQVLTYLDWMSAYFAERCAAPNPRLARHEWEIVGEMLEIFAELGEDGAHGVAPPAPSAIAAARTLAARCWGLA